MSGKKGPEVLREVIEERRIQGVQRRYTGHNLYKGSQSEAAPQNNIMTKQMEGVQL